jgi:hypothetical protein
MHRLRFGGGFAGLVFAVGALLIFLIGVPAFRPFLLLSIAVGVLIALVLRIARRRDPRPLSLK